MPRKSITSLRSERLDQLTAEAFEEFKAVSEVKHELAMDALKAQDDETQEAIKRVAKTLQTYATGYITLQLGPPSGKPVQVKIENDYLTMNLIWLAVEIAKDLAFVGIKLAEFQFPESLCAQCGSEIIPEQRKRKVR